MGANEIYPRDMVGYGQNPPKVKWRGDAGVALSFVVNYEEGGEGCILHGDPASEHLLSEIVGATPCEGVRSMNMESLYEYGSRAGFWRLRHLFVEREMTATAYVVGMALERHPEAGKAMVADGWDVASHGYRWIDYQYMDEATEREHIRLAVAAHETILGQRPLGLYQGKPSPNSLRLTAEEGGFLWSADCYNDDLPFWNTEYAKPLLMLPYTLTVNDMRFAIPNGFNNGRQWFDFMKDTLDFLLAETRTTVPKMMTVGLHCRLAGHPGRADGLARFMDYVKSKGDEVWVAQRTEIANLWQEQFPCPSQ